MIPIQSRDWFPELKLKDVKNPRGAWSEAEIFVYRKLACGVHDRALEQIILGEYLRTPATLDNSHYLAFYDAVLQIVPCLRSRGLFSGTPSLAEYEKRFQDLSFIRQFEQDMRRRFSSFDMVYKYSISKEIFQSINTLPEFTPEQLQVLENELLEVEKVIKDHHNGKSITVEVPTDNSTSKKSQPRVPYEFPRKAPFDLHGINLPHETPPTAPFRRVDPPANMPQSRWASMPPPSLIQGGQRLGSPFDIQNLSAQQVPQQAPPEPWRPVLGEHVEIPNGVIEATQNLYDALSEATRVRRAEEEYEDGIEHARKRVKTG